MRIRWRPTCWGRPAILKLPRSARVRPCWSASARQRIGKCSGPNRTAELLLAACPWFGMGMLPPGGVEACANRRGQGKEQQTMKRLGWAIGLVLMAGLIVVLLSSSTVRGDQFLRQGFEGRDPLWVQGPADAPFKVLAHRITEDHANGGQRSEYLQLQVEPGTFLYYTYEVGRAPVAEDLTLSVWVRANRPKIQLLARVVLPHERDPRNAELPLTVLIHGDPDKDAYKNVGRWERLAIRLRIKRLREKEQLLRAEL